MLKITVERDSTPVRVLFEGRLAGAWVDEARKAWQAVPHREAVIDLTGVTYMDSDGKALLATMWREGADLQAVGCCTKFIVDEITGGRHDAP
ncbi:MAG: anti-sigma factor antagonist [Nitrospiraceae bacterium]|nr:anti-sigma factor antagonist [Nitrospiraceae bacterium]